MEANNRTLPDWLTRIRTRQIMLPRFQRFEAWTHTTVTAVLNNVLRELPIGALLILVVGDCCSHVSYRHFRCNEYEFWHLLNPLLRFDCETFEHCHLGEH